MSLNCFFLNNWIISQAFTNNGKAGGLRRTSSIAAACPAKVVCNGNGAGGHFDQLDDLPCEKVSPDVYVYYLKALGTSSVSAALLLYVFYQVRQQTFQLFKHL